MGDSTVGAWAGMIPVFRHDREASANQLLGHVVRQFNEVGEAHHLCSFLLCNWHRMLGQCCITLPVKQSARI